MVTGSVFDCLVTTPELYPYLYTEWTKSAPIPTGKVKTIVEAFHKMHPGEKSFGNYHDDLLFLIGVHEYQSNWNLATRVDSLITKKNGELYLEHLVQKGDKTLVSSQLRKKIEQAANYVRYTYKDIFEKAETQVPIYFSVNDVRCKGLLDIVVDRGDFIELIDLKYTEHPLSNINNIVRSFRYDIQLSFYAYGLKELFRKPVHTSLLVYSALDNEAIITPISDLDLTIAEEGAVKETGNIYINDVCIVMKNRIKGWREYFTPVSTEPDVIQSVWN